MNVCDERDTYGGVCGMQGHEVEDMHRRLQASPSLYMSTADPVISSGYPLSFLDTPLASSRLCQLCYAKSKGVCGQSVGACSVAAHALVPYCHCGFLHPLS